MVTLRDCLKLQSFKGAKILAGNTRLDRAVTAVSVLEVSEIDSDMYTLAKGNEIVITAFYTIKDDIEKQCNTIRILGQRGEAAIVIFYVGIFLTAIDERVIKTAEEVGIPLICMPKNRADISYASVISSVMEKILYGDTFASRLISSTILNLLNFNNYDSFEDAIKDTVLKSNMQIVLINDTYEDVFSVETKNDLSIHHAIQYGIENQIDKSTSCTRFMIKNTVTYWGPVKLYNDKKYYLLIVDNDDRYSQSEISKFAEIVEIGIKMWKFNPIENVDAELIQAIKEGNNDILSKIRERENIKLNQILAVIEIINLKNKKRLVQIQKLALDNGFRAFISSENEFTSIIVINNNTKINRKVKEVTEFIQELISVEADNIFIDNRKIDSQEASQYFQQVKNYNKLLRIIYPNKKVLTKYDTMFAEVCNGIISGNKANAERYKAILNPLKESKSEEENVLVDTLSSFVLDCDFNIPKTAEVLFMHTNTIQYRIKKIKMLLKVEALDSSNLPFLSIALALKRIEYSDNT